MGKNQAGEQDGTGPHKNSAQRSVSDKGKKQESGQPCPVKYNESWLKK